MFVPKEGRVAAAGEIEEEIAVQSTTHQLVIVREGRLNAVDMGKEALTFFWIEIGNVQVLEDELADIEVQGCGFCIRRCGAAIGGHFCGFNNIELAIGFFDKVEVTVLEGDDLDMVFLPKDVGEAKPHIKAFGFVNRFCGIGFVWKEFYVLQADGDIREMLKDRDLAAIYFEATGKFFVKVVDGEADKALLLSE